MHQAIWSFDGDCWREAVVSNSTGRLAPLGYFINKPVKSACKSGCQLNRTTRAAGLLFQRGRLTESTWMMSQPEVRRSASQKSCRPQKLAGTVES